MQSNYRKPSPDEIDPDHVRLLPRTISEQNMAVVLQPPDPASEQPALVGMLHPNSNQIRQQIERELDAPIKGVQLDAADIRRTLSEVYEVSLEKLESLPTLQLFHDEQITFDPEPSVPGMVRGILSRAVRESASDVHFDIYRDGVQVRLRIDGMLLPIETPLTRDNYRKVVSKLKVVGELDIIEKRKAQDGRFTSSYEAADGTTRLIDVRISSVPGPHGEGIALRLMDPLRLDTNLDNLGLETDQKETLKRFIEEPSGMILVVGPTGSGKTQTLYSLIDDLTGRDLKIITAEDPIEYEFPRVDQKQVNRDMSFFDYTRAFLRQDPDVMLIGEIRDDDTAEITIRAAYTGHLVFSTLHTSRATTAISRLRTLGIEDDYIASVLNAVVFQRLVRVLCPDCKQPVNPDPDRLARYFETPPEGELYEAVGCTSCNGLGYRGRTGLFEILTITDELRTMIGSGASTQEIEREALREGFSRIHDHAKRKLVQGVTSLDEVNRLIEAPEQRELI